LAGWQASGYASRFSLSKIQSSDRGRRSGIFGCSKSRINIAVLPPGASLPAGRQVSEDALRTIEEDVGIFGGLRFFWFLFLCIKKRTGVWGGTPVDN